MIAKWELTDTVMHSAHIFSSFQYLLTFRLSIEKVLRQGVNGSVSFTLINMYDHLPCSMNQFWKADYGCSLQAKCAALLLALLLWPVMNSLISDAVQYFHLISIHGSTGWFPDSLVSACWSLPKVVRFRYSSVYLSDSIWVSDCQIIWQMPNSSNAIHIC